MATSASAAKDVGNSGRIQVLINVVSQNAANNTSQVRVRGQMSKKNNTPAYNNNGVPMTISGTKGITTRSTSTKFNVAGTTWVTVRDETYTVTHEANGTLTLSATYTLGTTGTSSFGSGGSVTATLTLDTLKPPQVVPGAPGKPTISNITSTTATASWTRPSNAGTPALTRYVVQIAKNSGFTDGLSTVYPTGTSYAIGGRARATTYYVRVRAENAAGLSAWSATTSFKTLPEVPTMANTSTAASITRNSASITSNSVSNNGGEAPSNIRVQYNTSASTSGATVVTRGSWASVPLTGLQALTTYHFRAAAYNSAGWGGYNNWKSFKTLDDAPDDITGITFTEVTETSFRINWPLPAANGATILSYSYEVSLTDSFAALVRSGSTVLTSVAVLGLLPGTRYHVRVRANATPNSGGWGRTTQLTAGRPVDAGLRVLAGVNGQIKEGTLYTFVNGRVKQLRVMYQHDGRLETS